VKELAEFLGDIMNTDGLLGSLRTSREVINDMPPLLGGECRNIWLAEYALVTSKQILIGGPASNPMIDQNPAHDTEDAAVAALAQHGTYKISQAEAQWRSQRRYLFQHRDVLAFPLLAFSHRPRRYEENPCYFFELSSDKALESQVSNDCQRQLLEKLVGYPNTAWAKGLGKWHLSVVFSKQGRRVPYVTPIKLELAAPFALPPPSQNEVLDAMDRRERWEQELRENYSEEYAARKIRERDDFEDRAREEERKHRPGFSICYRLC
jgi:hypothetical protein